MKKTMKKMKLVSLAIVVGIALIFGVITPALAAAPAFTTDVTKMTSADVYVKASSVWQNAIYF